MVAAMEPVGWLGEERNSCLGSGTCLVEDTAVIWRDIVGVKEDAFLYWTMSVIKWYAAKWHEVFTSLEAGDWSGYFYTSGKKVREGRKGKEKDEP